MEWILGTIGAIVVSSVTALVTSLFATEKRLKELREEKKFDYSLETAIVHLLESENYKKRSLKKLKHHLRGFRDDNELRQALIRAGAVAFGGDGENESWGLLSRNLEDVR